ncbi:MAG: PHP domain-containing protein, partial [Lactobacillaceae bacterium]|nr:PHP domain-containing protein [Lactobacillaceae bacterium]
MSFTPLYVNNEFEILSSPNKTDELIQAYKKAGIETLSIANHGNFFQSLQTYKKILQAGLKPVLGLLYEDNLLLAKNLQGYSNLSQFISQGQTNFQILED